MATLTWRDVATPQIRAPDLSDAADAITRGIAGIGQTAQALANAPEDRRKAALANEMALLDMERRGVAEQAQLASQLEKVLKTDRKEKALEEWGSAQSVLEAAARAAGQKGQSYDDFLKSDAYLSLSPAARAHGAANLSDAFWTGSQARENDRRWAAQHQLQRAQEARIARESALRTRALERELAKATETEKAGQGVTSTDPETNRTLKNFRNTVLGQLMEATGYRHEKSSIADLAKGAGIDDYSEYLESFARVNQQRVKQGRPALPEGVMKMVLAGQSGKNSWPFSMVNEVDQDVIDRNLLLQGDVYDAALKQEALLREMETRVANGGLLSDSMIQQELGQRPVVPARTQSTSKPGVSYPTRAAVDAGFKIPMRTY